ncbi:ubiquitin-like superfamily protein [Tanacetum coccineum]
MRIQILTETYILTMEVNMQETIIEIKRKIENFLGVPMSSQTLSVCDWELLDGLDLEDYPIVTENNLAVDKTETVGSLKEKIHIIDGTPIKQMTLFFLGVEMEEDFRNLSDYGVG